MLLAWCTVNVELCLNSHIIWTTLSSRLKSLSVMNAVLNALVSTAVFRSCLYPSVVSLEFLPGVWVCLISHFYGVYLNGNHRPWGPHELPYCTVPSVQRLRSHPRLQGAGAPPPGWPAHSRGRQKARGGRERKTVRFHPDLGLRYVGSEGNVTHPWGMPNRGLSGGAALHNPPLLSPSSLLPMQQTCLARSFLLPTSNANSGDFSLAEQDSIIPCQLEPKVLRWNHHTLESVSLPGGDDGDSSLRLVISRWGSSYTAATASEPERLPADSESSPCNWFTNSIIQTGCGIYWFYFPMWWKYHVLYFCRNVRTASMFQ